MNSYYKKKIVYCGFGILLVVALIFITVNIVHLHNNEIRKKLDFTPFQYQRLIGMVDSDIEHLEFEPDFQMPLWENNTPYRALLADSRTVYIVINPDNNSVACVLDGEYHLIFGMIEQGRV